MLNQKQKAMEDLIEYLLDEPDVTREMIYDECVYVEDVMYENDALDEHYKSDYIVCLGFIHHIEQCVIDVNSLVISSYYERECQNCIDLILENKIPTSSIKEQL